MLGLFAWLTGHLVAGVQETFMDAGAIERAKKNNAISYIDARGRTVYLTGANPKARGPIVNVIVAENGHRVGVNSKGQVVRDYTEEYAKEKVEELRRRPVDGKTVVIFDDGLAHWSIDRQIRANMREERLPLYYSNMYGTRYMDIQTENIYVKRSIPYMKDGRSVQLASFYMDQNGLLVRPTDEQIEKTSSDVDLQMMMNFISFFNALQRREGFILSQHPECRTDTKYYKKYGNPYYCNEYDYGMSSSQYRYPTFWRLEDYGKPIETIKAWIYTVQQFSSTGESLTSITKRFKVFEDHQIGDQIELDQKQWKIIEKQEVK